MPKHYNAPPAMQIDATKTYVAHFTTSRGEFDIQLFAKEAPTRDASQVVGRREFAILRQGNA